MSQTMVRIGQDTHAVLKGLAAKEGSTMQAVLDKAVEAYRRIRFLEQVNESYDEVRRDDLAWAQVREERAAWDTTLDDGLQEAPARRSRRGHGRKKTS